MLKIFLTFILWIYVSFAYSQADSLFMVKYAQVTGMPSGEYNDCWGYVAPNGDEFAIIGSRTAINIFKINNPNNPIMVYQKIDDTNSTWRDFKTYQNYIYAVADVGNEGLEIINMNNYTFTQSTGYFLRAHNIFIDVPNGRLYVAGSNGAGIQGGPASEGLIIYDLTQNPGNPTMIKTINLDTLIDNPGLNLYIHDVYVKDNIAYGSHGYSGFYMWNVADVNNIQYLGHLEASGSFSWYNHSSWLHPNGTHAVIAEEVPIGRPMGVFELLPDGNGQYDINEVKRFSNPLELPFTNNRPHNPFIKGNGLYVAYYHDGIQVYDVTDPVNPIRVAYYDTYPENSGSYSGYHGAWGVYPFLPSGTIIGSDIEHGLFLLGLQLGKMKIETGEIFIQEAGKGIVFSDSTGVIKRLSVTNTGQLSINTVSQPTGNNKIKNGDLEIVTPDKGIILKSPSGALFSLKMNNNGSLTVSQTTLPTTNIKVISGDLYLDNMHKGFIMHSPNGNRWKTSLTKTGTLKSYRFSF